MRLIRTQLGQDTPFSFTCSCCLRCCHHKSIQLNPYETARLAANRGISTTEFIRRFTTSNGTYLGWTDTGACIFLDESGCNVHPDRPLVCRLYPLGRHLSAAGIETFSELEREDGCKAAYGDANTIGDYLVEQGVGPYVEAADRYLDLLWELTSFMRNSSSDPAQRKHLKQATGRIKMRAWQKPSPLMDMDATVRTYCEQHGEAFPEGLADKTALHIKAVESWMMHAENRR